MDQEMLENSSPAAEETAAEGPKRNKNANANANQYDDMVGYAKLPRGWTYSEDGRRIIEHPVEQAMLRRVTELREQGLGYKKIVKALAAEGFKNRAGRACWASTDIAHMLRTKGALHPNIQQLKDNLDRIADAEDALAAGLTKNAAGVALDDPDPLRWGEAYLRNRDGSPRQYWAHQVEDLRADEANIVHLDGRDVGKTANLATLALHYAMTARGGAGLIAAALNGQLWAILEEIEAQLEQNPLLEATIARGRHGQRQFQRHPYPRIKFRNGCVLYFRPAGPYGEAFRSLHVERIWLDEGAWLSEEAWRALRQCLKSGGKLRVYSTPNGLRKSTYYRLTQASGWRVFRWPSWLNPAWDTAREKDLLEFYGGKGSVGWQHEVAGEHGAVSYGAFAPEQFARCQGNVLEYRRVAITGEELADCGSEAETTARFEMLLGVMPSDGRYWIGGDLGYTRDPTEIVVFREEEYAEDGPEEASRRAPALRPRLRLVLRVHLEGVGYPQIGACLDVLDQAFNPEALGVDNGGNGLAVVQELMTLDRYRRRGISRFEGRLFGFDFGGATRFELSDGTEARKRTKELMTTLINGALQREEFLFPEEDREIEDQFLTQTYSLNNGVVIYSKGNDHIVDAIRCALLAREKSREGGLLNETVEKRPRLWPVILCVPRRRHYEW